MTPVERTTSNSSARDWSKCSHSALDCSTPHSDSSFFSIGTHEPQPVPALVQDLMPGTSTASPESTTSTICCLVTAWHEHTCASCGRVSSTPPSGPISATGSPGTGLPTSGRSDAYLDASPTRMPPSRVFASSDTTTLA